jgi:hypothetical protein
MTLFSCTRRFAMAAVVAMVLASVSPVFAQFVTRVGRVEARSTDTWSLRVPAGNTMITVRGDGDTDLDCFAYDTFGRLLDSDTDETDYCVLSIGRIYSGDVRLEIKNLGRVYNRYVLELE